LNYLSYHLHRASTKTNELPMWSMSSEVWPASRSMEDNIRSYFDKGGERYTAFRRSMQSLLWHVAFEISLHVWNFHAIYVFFGK
jgi:hypothetical protein